MDFSVNYRAGRILLSCLGLWPYQTPRTRYIQCILLTPFLISAAIFQMSPLFVKKFSLDVLLNVFSVCTATIFHTCKYYTTFFNISKVQTLMKQMQIDWETLKDAKERQIIQKYTEVGKIITIVMLTFSYTCVFLFMMIYFSPTILDFVMPLNESRRMMFENPFAIEYYVPWKKCIHLLQLYMLLLMFITSNSILATEVLTVACLQHICAMFVITSYRIERAVNKSQKFSLDLAKNSNDHKYIVEAIDSHLRAIQFSDFFRSLSGIVYLTFIPLGIISLSVNMYQFSRYVSLNDVTNGIMTFVFLFLHLIFVFFNNLVGQKVTNHSEIVFKTICNARWYTTSLYMQKCLLLIMQRSMKSSTLKIGGFYVPSFESFLLVIRKSLSYFMVIHSIQS